MPIEYASLVYMTLFFLFSWVPVSVGKLQSYGSKWILSNRQPIEGKELVSWAARCERAGSNLKDNFPAFVVAILILGALEKFDQSTSTAALTFLFGRLGHYFSYAIGNVTARFLFYVASLSANVFLLIKVFI